jgi:transposase
LIFIDESGANLGMVSDYARAEGGARAKAAKPFDIGEKFSIIGAISSTGIVGMMYIESATDGNAFETFIAKCLIPNLERGKFVIMDNVGFHKQEEIRILIEKAGSRVVFLPPYSPDLSPIEQMWSKVKYWLKKIMPRTKSKFHDALAEALASLNQEDFEEWFSECGYAI